ncbi:hypothetical protein P4O66_014780 [Electrophorus voltai]|uniref:Uncharacterized protein n=1 Tax=Electrophorus voltai TaxID=2609070 RepID=A0AAD9DRW1_9TELE|nr:hypothetical protein P4O66_014780 [Electrophorus voltai]
MMSTPQNEQSYDNVRNSFCAIPAKQLWNISTRQVSGVTSAVDLPRSRAELTFGHAENVRREGADSSSPKAPLRRTVVAPLFVSTHVSSACSPVRFASEMHVDILNRTGEAGCSYRPSEDYNAHGVACHDKRTSGNTPELPQVYPPQVTHPSCPRSSSPGNTPELPQVYPPRREIETRCCVRRLNVTPALPSGFDPTAPPSPHMCRCGRLLLTGKARILIFVSFLVPPLLRLDMFVR